MKPIVVGALAALSLSAPAYAMIEGPPASMPMAQRTNNLQPGDLELNVRSKLGAEPLQAEVQTCGGNQPWTCRIEWFYVGGPVGVRAYFYLSGGSVWRLNSWEVLPPSVY